MADNHGYTWIKPDGTTHIVRSDTKAGAIHAAILDYVGKDFTGAGGKVGVEELDDWWLRITVVIPKGMDEEDATNLAMDLSANLTGKGWYEVKDRGEDDGGWTQWFVVRHKGGPFI
jgi:hypothetical protein